MNIPTPFDTFFCGTLLREDVLAAQDIIRRFGGTPKATKKPCGLMIVGYFPEGLPHAKREQIASAFGNAGIFAI